MTFAEMKTEVTRRLNESATAETFWTQDDIETALQEAYAEMSDYSEWYETSTSLAMTGLTYYNLTTNILDEFLSPRRAFNVQTNRWLEPIDVRDLDYHTYVQWENNQGEPQKCLQRGLWWLGVYPKNSSGFISIYYTAIPLPFQSSSEEPGFPRQFHYGLVEYALYDLLCQEAETMKALLHWNQFLEHREGLKFYVQNRTSYDRIGALRG